MKYTVTNIHFILNIKRDLMRDEDFAHVMFEITFPHIQN